MARQYQEMKALHKDAVLFFRLGDFYEMFNDDAELASRELDLTLTGRGKDENRMPMCGIPYHAAEGYIAKLIGKGYKVAICEQVEDPKLAKGLVKRDIIRIVTPGTVIETSMLSEKSNNYLMAINHEKGKFGLAFVDATTGEFKLSDFDSAEKLADEIKRIGSAEIIKSDLIENDNHFQQATSSFKDIYDNETAIEKLLEHFKVKSLESFGLAGKEVALGAAAAILDYLKETQKTTLDHINSIKLYRAEDYMFIDATTRRNLELTQTARDKSFRGSLLWVLDRTKTSMGSRLLRQWLLQPLLDAEGINRRLEAVEELFHNGLLRAELGEGLKRVYDIERLTGKVATQSANARDLVALKDSLRQLPKIMELMKESKAELLKEPPRFIGAGSFVQEITDLISKAIIDEPPFVIKEGGLIKPGFNAELDELKKATGGGKQWLAELEASERKRTGIKSLKVGFTRVFGYFIEVTNSNAEQAPPDYIRKQTLVNAERFITPELKEKESFILNADERMKELEYQILCDLRVKVAAYTKELQAVAVAVAQTDILLSLAEVAVENRYCRPKLRMTNDELRIKAGRHPVVEKTLGEFQFVPNDVELDEKQSFLLITGPNMGGKSTYMRQTALICLMAQIGSFVPARSAELCLIDRIFTRIGALDDIYSGQSTFMVEMTETANILNNATENSLIILDEIGRGTATFDGMSIAAAVAEYIHKNVKAKTLFATHYHEITQLADKHSGMKNISVTVKEEGDRITFLHKIADGPADRSYGIQVAKLAGLPEEVVKRSKDIYNTLAMVETDLGGNRDQVSLF
ncbi:DNA mismatch repair protein MutS [candidate division WOR-1 bacterium RIFCSPHIGHO2_01_FULL_53_15]|uniref:DNA mismatch repair protein MutS n=1 Tax=candidate division WOR-1 bacterium RIFCSPHIGHO2_01_FULL_53_15 TaxID=1802564 RepID=A0A1F4Q4G7_UNCSA|nr:MAG: DNA mismatch repair protein MutS [candidate division WOR-1 bacterium RIFCSPHIGHO2_01_FULL_53_15]OGC13952.1 MAG: DNA mismatch repair protein MutS [candidate division WOR-1 bacterium RIFCSPHIGHO2_02_FULL_53_26]